MAHDVFISYSHKDASVAEAISAGLESRGIVCWYAPRNIVSGTSWAGSIVNGIRNCKVFILVFSAASNASTQVLREINNALNFQKTIIPFRIDGSEMCDDFMYYLNATHWFDAVTPPMAQRIEELGGQIAALLGPEKFKPFPIEPYVPDDMSRGPQEEAEAEDDWTDPFENHKDLDDILREIESDSAKEDISYTASFRGPRRRDRRKNKAEETNGNIPVSRADSSPEADHGIPAFMKRRRLNEEPETVTEKAGTDAPENNYGVPFFMHRRADSEPEEARQAQQDPPAAVHTEQELIEDLISIDYDDWSELLQWGIETKKLNMEQQRAVYEIYKYSVWREVPLSETRPITPKMARYALEGLAVGVCEKCITKADLCEIVEEYRDFLTGQ